MHSNNTVQTVLADLKAKLPHRKISETRHVPMRTIRHWRKKFKLPYRYSLSWKKIKQIARGR